MESPLKQLHDEDSKTGNNGTNEGSPRGRTFRLGSLLAILLGTVISTALIIHHNFSSVLEAIHRIGWGFMLVLVIQISGIALNGLAWRVLFRSASPGFTNSLIILRWIRESINYLLPVGRVGGDIVAVRLLVARQHNADTAAAGVVADKTLEVLGLFLFALAGIVILFESGGNTNDAKHWAIRALGITFAVLAAFFAAQRWGLLKLIDKVVRRFSRTWGGSHDSDIASIHEAVWAIYSDIPRLILAAFLHAMAWVPGALQVWVAVHFMGIGVGFIGAFVIESFTMIVCSAAFLMPAALGAQEAAYMIIGWRLFGIPPAVGLALSLVQRMKDVLVGIPGLLVWQGFEGSRLCARWRSRRN